MATEPDLKKPYLMQLGVGTDLVGADATKAAERAVHDAVARNRLLFRTHGEIQDKPLQVRIVVGVPEPDHVDTDLVRRAVPEDDVLVTVEKGGLEAETGLPDGPVLVAVAAVTVGTEA